MRTRTFHRVSACPAILAATLLGVSLSTTTLADSRLGTGVDATVSPHVKVFNGVSLTAQQSFFAYSTGFTGGVRVALGDIDGDGTTDLVTGTGSGTAGHVKVFSGVSGVEIRSFFAYGAYTGGVFVAAGDVNDDGHADIIVGAGDASPPFLRVFDAQTGSILHDTMVYEAGWAGGVRVASGDVNGDGFADIIVARGPGGPPHVRVLNGRNLALIHGTFDAYTASFSGGVYVAAGDVNGDGRADLITGAGTGSAGGHVKAFSGVNLASQLSFLAYAADFTGGVRVAAGDVNGDGRDDVITGVGPGAPPDLKIFYGPSFGTPTAFLAYSNSFTGGFFVAGPVVTHTVFRDGFE